MSTRVLLDTNILIDFLRGKSEAVTYMKALAAAPSLSVVSIAELFTGVRDGEERTELDEFVRQSVLIDVDEQIATRAGLMLRDFRKSHAIGMADALIAATAELESATLVTLNTKHYPMLTNVHRPY